jgi:hypothetical protein
VAHRQRLPHGADGAEASAPLRRLEQVEVDLDREDLLHTAHVGVPVALVGVEERAGLRDAGRRVHDLVAVDLAAAALDLVLWSKRQGACRLLDVCHGQIVGTGPRLRKT